MRIQGPSYKRGFAPDLHVKHVETVPVLMGGLPYDSVPCGNIVALAGIDDFIVKTATLTTLQDSLASSTLLNEVSTSL